MRATCSIAISIWTQSQGHYQGLLFKDQDKDKDLNSKDKDKDKDYIVKDKDQDKDCILVLKESLRTRTNITATLPLHHIFSCPAPAPLPLIQFSDPLYSAQERVYG